MLRRILAVLWLYLALIAGIVPAMGQGTTIQRTCGKSTFYDASTSGATQIVPNTAQFGAGSVSQGPIFICGYTMTGSAAGVGLVYGTGTNCATGQTKITPLYAIAAGIPLVDGSPSWRGLYVPAGNALCVNVNAASPQQVIVYFDNSPL